MNPFDAGQLWLKSKTYVQRSLEARDDEEPALSHLWAALALELLAKSVLADVHPTLIADPTKPKNLLAACGRTKSDDARTITAKTAYERLQHLSKAFDKTAKDFSMRMANQRNAELHSGSSLVAGLDPEAWVPSFWRVAKILCELKNQDLSAWVGEDEAQRVLAIIADRTSVHAQNIRARIARRRAGFESTYPDESARSHPRKMSEREYWPYGFPEDSKWSDGHVRAECPACGSKGWLFGMEHETESLPPEYVGDEYTGDWIFSAKVSYFSESFGCPVCTLHLSGQEELEVAGLPDEFDEIVDAEPDYEPDYGND